MTPHQIQACCKLSDFLARLQTPPPPLQCTATCKHSSVKTARAESGNRGPLGQGRDMYLSALLKKR